MMRSLVDAGLPELYMYMLKQRKKILGPAPKSKKA
jgi:hypothetical protein